VIERFLCTARAAATVQHPNLVPILEVGEVAGTPYLAMPYLEGLLLAQRLRKGPLPVQEAVQLIGRLADGVQAAHQKGVLLRDLTPSNVLVLAGGEPVLLDFGLARQEGSARLTVDGQVLGTPGSIAPEMLTGQIGQDTPASDVFGLGVLLYECLTGQLPFGRTLREVMQQLLTRELAPPSRLRPEVPPALDAICRKALARQPEARYASTGSLAADLRTVLLTAASPTGDCNKDGEDAGREHPDKTGIRSPVRRRIWLAGLGVAAVLVGLPVASKVWQSQPGERQQETPSERPEERIPNAENPRQPKTKPVAFPDFREVHGIDAKALRAWADGLANAGYRPVLVSSRAGSAEPRLNALAIRNNRQTSFRLDVVSDKEGGQLWDQLCKEGYALRCSHPFPGPAGRYWAVLWTREGAFLHWFGSLDFITGKVEEGRAGRWRPLSLSGARSPGDEWIYSAQLGPDEGLAWEARYALGRKELETLLTQERTRGFRPDVLTCYWDGKAIRFMTVMVDNRAKADWDVQLDLLPAAYERALAEQQQRGLRPIAVASYLEGAETRYAAVWLGTTPESGK
jgi:hypothetical protein